MIKLIGLGMTGRRGVAEYVENCRLADIWLILAEIKSEFLGLSMKLAGISEKLAGLLQ
jgi:hypothetical protein